MFNVWTYICILLQTFLITCLASDLYSDAVRNFDTEAFKKNIGGDISYFVNFFAPWCGYCKRLTPVWNELAEKYNVDDSFHKIVVAKVDCTVETPLCAEQGVSGYPSLVFYNPHSSEGTKYKGKRELLALEEFITVNIKRLKDDEATKPPPPMPIVSSKGALELTDETFHNTIDWGMHFVNFYAPWCGHCQTLAPIWDELAVTSDSAVTISKIDCTTNQASCGEFEVKAFPTLIWIFNGKKVEKYLGQRTMADLKRFLDDMKQSVQNDPDNEEGRIPEEPKKSAELVVHLTEGNFENAINQGVTFVKFFAPWCGHCRRLAPTWEELARKFVTTTGVKIAKVDCTIDNELCNQYKVQGYPTLLIFRNGQRLTEYKDNRDLESLHKFVLDNLIHDEL